MADIWILKSVQFPKSGARRGIWILDGPSRFLETVQLSKIRGEARYLESGQPPAPGPLGTAMRVRVLHAKLYASD